MVIIEYVAGLIAVLFLIFAAFFLGVVVPIALALLIMFWFFKNLMNGKF